MSIENWGLSYKIECDICGYTENRDFDSFYDAVYWKQDKSNGWISRKDKKENEWHDICPICQESESVMKNF